jgi:Spy/CpxP family protein refolding chaperone
MKRTSLLPLAFLPLLCAPLLAQAPAAPPTPTQGSGQPNPAPPPDPRGGRMDRDRGREGDRGPERGQDRGGLMGIVPPGTWWKNPEVIARLSLTAEQQAKMDEIFRQNRLQLVDVKASLEKEQINLEPLLNANPVDTNKAMAEIAKIADLRANLEKADARMLLGLRSVLTAEQWTKLHARPEGQQRGPGGQRGPGAPPPAGDAPSQL